MNYAQIAAAHRALADAYDSAGVTEPAGAPETAPAPAQKRGRGRPAKGEDAAPAAPAPAPAAPEAADPFQAPPAAVTPAVTVEDVRAALTALKDATDQATAVNVLKTAGGAENLSSLKREAYAAVVAAANAAMPANQKAPAPEVDPFEVPAAAAPAKPATLEEIKAACIAAGKRTAQDRVQAVVMKHGGKAKNPDTGLEGPSLKALPESAYAAALAEINALPSTK